MSKKLKKIALCIAGALVFAGVAAPSHAQFQKRTLRLAIGTSSDHPIKQAFDAMNTCLQDKSGGKTQLRVFWNGVLGGDLSVIQSVRSGTIDMMAPITSALVPTLPEFGVFDLPYLFHSSAEADQVLDGAVGEQFLARLPAVGIVGLGWMENGFRHTTNSKRAINRLEDFAGLKLRVTQSPVQMDIFSTLGANPVPMAFGELYSALETRTVDGEENALGLIKSMKFYEVQKYLTLSQHTYSPVVVMVSKRVWDRFSGDERSALQECTHLGSRIERDAYRQEETAILAELRGQNTMQVNTIEDAEIERIRAQVAGVYARSAPTIGSAVIEQVQAELARIRAK